MAQGYLALVLHAHLPFVRHPEYDDFLEEDWFYEAITETYIPLVNMMDGLINDGCDFRLTMSITPPLAAMLSDSFGIMVRAGFHCTHPLYDDLRMQDGALRISAYLYNEPAELDYAAEAIGATLARLGRAGH